MSWIIFCRFRTFIELCHLVPIFLYRVSIVHKLTFPTRYFYFTKTSFTSIFNRITFQLFRETILRLVQWQVKLSSFKFPFLKNKRLKYYNVDCPLNSFVFFLNLIERTATKFESRCFRDVYSKFLRHAAFLLWQYYCTFNKSNCMRVKQIIINKIACKYFFYFLIIEISLTRIMIISSFSNDSR